MISFLFPSNVPQLLNDSKYDETKKEYEQIYQRLSDTSIPPFLIKSSSKSTNLYRIIMNFIKKNSISALRERFPTIEDADQLNEAIKSLNTNSFPSLRQRAKQLKYSDYCIIKEKCPHLSQFLTSKLFLDLSNKTNHTVFQNDLISHVIVQSYSVEYCIKLIQKDKKNTGSLTKSQFIKFVQEISQDFEFVDDLSDAIEKGFFIYCSYVTERFFVSLDPLKTGRISIENIVESDLFLCLVKLAERDGTPNPFDDKAAMHFLNEFIQMDGDKDGLLTKDDLLHMPGTRFTLSFVDQVFDTIASSCMTDFGWYFRFKIAYGNLGKPWANLFFFDIMDIDKNNELNETEVNYFFHDLALDYEDFYQKDHPPFENFATELFDICSATSSRISKDEFINLTEAPKFVKHLVDLAAFAKWEHNDTIPVRGESYDDDDEL